MIYGIGTDFVLIERMHGLIERHGAHAAEKFLAAEEIAAFEESADQPRFLAKRFAAKEALSKALGTGLRAPVLLPNIAVKHDALGKPLFAFAPELQHWLDKHSLTTHLTLSDERELALASVVVEQRDTLAPKP